MSVIAEAAGHGQAHFGGACVSVFRFMDDFTVCPNRYFFHRVGSCRCPFGSDSILESGVSGVLCLSKVVCFVWSGA